MKRHPGTEYPKHELQRAEEKCDHGNLWGGLVGRG